MPFYSRNPEKFVRTLTLATLSFMICWELLLVLAQIRPFWIDEWRIIYNLKYKSSAALWGQLDFMQQFPRIYLELIKAFCARFDYSYFTLRLPSFLAGTAAIGLCLRVMKQIYQPGQLNRFLFALIIVSSHAFTEYFVQIKQYTMEMLLSLLAMWQMVQLGRENLSMRRYLFLCLSFFIAPFFSYTYPIVAAPIFIIVSIQTFHFVRQTSSIAIKAEWIFTQWLPLAMCVAGTAFFYISDVAQLMADTDMHHFWSYQMMGSRFDAVLLFRNTFKLFAQVGGGDFFEIVFGITGVVAFIHAVHKSAGIGLMRELTVYEQVRFYSVSLLVLSIVLFITGQLPLGEARLNIFTVPAIAVLIVDLVEQLRSSVRRARLAKWISALLLLGACGHIFTSSVNLLIGEEYNRKLNIYVNTENAIIMAQQKKIPILVTSGVAFPYEKLPLNTELANTLCIPPGYHPVPGVKLNDDIPGDWVLQTFPAYKQREGINVYAIGGTGDIQRYMTQLPPDISTVLVGDGINYRLVKRGH